MSKKQVSKKSKKPEIQLSNEETRELELILDRLSVQSPEGQSLDSYIKSLKQTLESREELVGALIERLAKNPSEVGFRTFSGLKGLIESSRLARVVKQVLYRFQQRGFGVSEKEAGEQRVVLVQSESREAIAHFAPEPEAFWLVSTLIHESGYREPLIITAYPEEGFGIMNVKVAENSHRVYREYIQNISASLSRKPLEIPLWHMAGLFFELIELVGEGEKLGDVERAKQLLRPHYDPERLPYVYDLMPALENPDARVGEIADPDLLLKDTAFPWLFPPKEEMLPYQQKIKEIDTSLLVVSPEIQQERSREIVLDAAEKLCSGNRRRLLQRFLEEEAMWLKLSGNPERAMWAWIAAQQLAGGGAASKNIVCLKIIGTSLAYYWPKDFEPEEAPKTTEDPFCRTDSGLIVPCD